MWCVAVHQTYIGGPLGQGPPTNTTNNTTTPLPPGVEGKLRTLNASLTVMTTQHAAATAAAGTTTTTTKTGFGSFPVYTQHMILHALSRLDSDAVCQALLDSLAFIFAFPNTAFVGRHVHNLLRDKANHDVLIPTGLCTAIRHHRPCLRSLLFRSTVSSVPWRNDVTMGSGFAISFGTSSQQHTAP